MVQGMPPSAPPSGPQGGWIVQQGQPSPMGSAPAPEHRPRSQPYVVATFVTLGLGIVLAFGLFTGGDPTIEALVWSIPLFLVAMVLGIVGAVIAGQDKRAAAETAAATAGAVAGAAGAAIAAIVAVILVIIAILTLFAWMMMCVMTFGMAC